MMNSLNRPKSKGLLKSESYAGPDISGDPAMRYVDINTRTPWTTSEKSWRASTAPLQWPQELRAFNAAKLPFQAPSEEELEEDPFLQERVQLDNMRVTSNKINKFYIPISKLPPLGGSDPRLSLGKRPPSCYVDYSVPRAARTIHRWESMPRLRSQLPTESLQKIQAATRQKKPRSRERSPQAPQGSGRNSGRGEAPGIARNDTDGRLTNAFREGPGSARGKKEHPHIPCDCCDHQVQKSWMPPRSADSVPGSGRPAPGSGRPGGRAATPIWKNTAVNPEEDRLGSSQSERKRHTVSWEEPHSSDAESEHWEEQL